MKHIHFPTLLLHAALTVFGTLTINHYHGAFLLIASAVLIAHIIWAARSKHDMFPSHLIGCAAQFFIYHLDIIAVHSGVFGLGGGEFALFFYQIVMFLSCIIELIIRLVKIPAKQTQA